MVLKHFQLAPSLTHWALADSPDKGYNPIHAFLRATASGPQW